MEEPKPHKPTDDNGEDSSQNGSKTNDDESKIDEQNDSLTDDKTKAKKGKDSTTIDDNSLKSEPISSIPIDRNLIKKRGFLIAFNSSDDSKKELDIEISKSRAHFDNVIKEYRESQQSKIANLEQLNTRNTLLLTELDKKKADYEHQIKNDNPQKKDALESEIKLLSNDILKALEEMGRLKESIADSSISNLQEQLKKVISINRDLQTEQNIAHEKEFTNDAIANQNRVSFYTSLLKTYQEHYKLASERLKLLTKDGINGQTSSFLLFLGTLASLVSGWWFSVWTGPLPAEIDKSYAASNSNVRLFILDNLGRYLGSMTAQQILWQISGYIFGVGLLSYICYRLSVKFGFINKKKKKNEKNKEVSQNESFDEIEIGFNEDDDILRARFKGQNWWSFWLKIAPFIAAIVPLLAIISQQATKQTSGGFQNLFDSMIDQFIGSCIAISFSAFTILFFSRITENLYHNDDNSEKKSGFTFLLGFVIFSLMIGSMFLYRTPFLKDIRTVSILGFLVSCTATGFSLGYGYLFRSLEENTEFLLSRINFIASVVDLYSKPFRVNYTSNKWLRSRIYILQQKMMDVLQNRQELAAAIAGGYKFEHLEKKDDQTPRNDLKQNEEVQKPKPKEEPSQRNSVKSMFDGLLNVLKFQWFRHKERQLNEEDKYKINHSMTDTDQRYFSEKAEYISQLNERLKRLKLKIEKLELEEINYLRNEGTWRSIKDQISNMEQKKSYLANHLSKVNQNLLAEVERLERQKNEETTLLTEGYYTGLWFKDIDKNNNQKLLWA